YRFYLIWYTYNTAVADHYLFVLKSSMYWLYGQQLTCDARATGCFANVSVHPEDRFANQYDPGKSIDGVVIVGIDDASVRAIGKYPLPRDRYADALLNLEKAGAQVVAFDVGFTDPSGADKKLAETLASASVPVVLAYGGTTEVASGKVVQKGVDQIPLKAFARTPTTTRALLALSRIATWSLPPPTSS